MSVGLGSTYQQNPPLQTGHSVIRVDPNPQTFAPITIGQKEKHLNQAALSFLNRKFPKSIPSQCVFQNQRICGEFHDERVHQILGFISVLF
jgi:hypothetical protein